MLMLKSAVLSMNDLSNDKDLQSNIQNSSESAYEATGAERVASRIMDGVFDGTMSRDTDKAEFYTELSENNSVVIQIRNTTIWKNDLSLSPHQ